MKFFCQSHLRAGWVALCSVNKDGHHDKVVYGYHHQEHGFYNTVDGDGDDDGNDDDLRRL